LLVATETDAEESGTGDWKMIRRPAAPSGDGDALR
jgi:hypothetical protein